MLQHLLCHLNSIVSFNLACFMSFKLVNLIKYHSKKFYYVSMQGTLKQINKAFVSSVWRASEWQGSRGSTALQADSISRQMVKSNSSRSKLCMRKQLLSQPAPGSRFVTDGCSIAFFVYYHFNLSVDNFQTQNQAFIFYKGICELYVVALEIRSRVESIPGKGQPASPDILNLIDESSTYR